MDSPTAWNVNDKSDYLSVNSDGIRVDYKKSFLLEIYKKFLHQRNYLHLSVFFI
jgi:hypothetical protein